MTSGVPYAEVIGDPISHSKSPLIHNFWLKKLGIKGAYRSCHVYPEALTDYLTRRRTDPAWLGCNLTLPHKIAALSMVDEIDWSAGQVGATNCIVSKQGKLTAFNTDGAGVDRAISIGHSSACIIGAGGAARAVLPTLDVLSAYDIRILARDPVKAASNLTAIMEDLRFFPLKRAPEAFAGVDGIINASPLGMTGQPQMPAVVLEALTTAAEDAYVFDMVYSPLDTPLLRRARELGFMTSDGLTMLIGQAAHAFRLFFGELPSPEHDEELRELLTA